jgi:putative flippase GtrA
MSRGKPISVQSTFATRVPDMDLLDALLNHRAIAPWVARVPSAIPLVQVLRFGLVGGLVTLLHVAVALSVNGLFGIDPLWANFIAFLVACGVSYALNWLWTFDAVSRHGAALPKFLAVSVSGFILNQSIVFALVTLAGHPMWVAMLPVMVVIPVFSFIMSKTWVFLADRQPA